MSNQNSVNLDCLTMNDAPKILNEMEYIKKQAYLDYLEDRKKHYKWFYDQQKYELIRMQNGIQ